MILCSIICRDHSDTEKTLAEAIRSIPVSHEIQRCYQQLQNSTDVLVPLRYTCQSFDKSFKASASPTIGLSSRMEGLTDGLSFVLILACQSCVLPTRGTRHAGINFCDFFFHVSRHIAFTYLSLSLFVPYFGLNFFVDKANGFCFSLWTRRWTLLQDLRPMRLGSRIQV